MTTLNTLHPDSLQRYLYYVIQNPDEVELFIQPIFNFEFKLLAFEVLTRFSSYHISMGTFLHLLAGQRDYEILRRFQHYLLQRSFLAIDRTICPSWFNLAPVCYAYSDYIEDVVNVMQPYIVSGCGSTIGFEINELWFNWMDTMTLIRCLQRLQEIKVTIILDDIDASFLERQLYRAIPAGLINYVKLCPSLINRLLQGWNTGLLHIKYMKNRGWHVVAEGIENEAMWSRILATRLNEFIDYYQGYWFGIPSKVQQ